VVVVDDVMVVVDEDVVVEVEVVQPPPRQHPRHVLPASRQAARPVRKTPFACRRQSGSVQADSSVRRCSRATPMHDCCASRHDRLQVAAAAISVPAPRTAINTASSALPGRSHSICVPTLDGYRSRATKARFPTRCPPPTRSALTACAASIGPVVAITPTTLES
jgi:hypothetical protein